MVPPAWGPCKQGNRRELRGRCSKRSISSQGSTPSLIPVGRWTDLCFSLDSFCLGRPLLSPPCPLMTHTALGVPLPSCPPSQSAGRWRGSVLVPCPFPLTSSLGVHLHAIPVAARLEEGEETILMRSLMRGRECVFLSSSRHPIPCLPCPPASVGLRPIARIISRPEYGVGCCTCTSASPPSYPPPA